MTVDDALQPNLRRLNTELRNIASFYAVATGSVAIWYGRLLSNLLLLIGAAPVQYVTGHVDRDQQSLKVAVFTEDLLVMAEIANISSDVEAQSAFALSRGKLAQLEVSSGEGVFSNSTFSNWPTEIRLRLTYPGLDELEIPLERKMNGDHLAELRELLASLQTDLRKGARC
jgi:hypothetical protein